MGLPFWAQAPGNRYHHDDNYSDVEVVWTDRESGDVQIQTQLGYIDLAGDVFGLGVADPRDLPVSVLDQHIRLAPVVDRLRRTAATRVQLVCFSAAAAVVGAGGGVLLTHLWHP